MVDTSIVLPVIWIGANHVERYPVILRCVNVFLRVQAACGGRCTHRKIRRPLRVSSPRMWRPLFAVMIVLMLARRLRLPVVWLQLLTARGNDKWKPWPACEDLGHDLSPELKQGLMRPYQAAEVESARRALGLGNIDGTSSRGVTSATALGKTGFQRAPVAVWVVGPSAAGKSTIATRAATSLGLELYARHRKLNLPFVDRLRSSTGWSASNNSSTGSKMDAVLIDGEAFRANHGGYQAVVQDGLSRRCVWRQAYPSLRQTLREQKAALLQAAMRLRRDLLIPHTCLRRADCWRVLKSLEALGYTNHVVLVLGDRDEIRRRGEKRARAAGKRFDPTEWDVSVHNSFGVVARANGYAELVWATPAFDWILRRARPDEVLAEAAARMDAAP